jgi:hypothetical protein
MKPSTDEPVARSPAAERVRRHRERRKKGFRCVSLRKYCGVRIEKQSRID